MDGKSWKDKLSIYTMFGMMVSVLILVAAIIIINFFDDNELFDIAAAMEHQYFFPIVLATPLLSLALVVAGVFLDGEKDKTVSQFYSNRWMTKQELNKTYIACMLTRLSQLNKTGTLVRFEQMGRDVAINMVPKDYHTIVLGTTGSGKTQGYVLPYVYTLGHTAQKPNMVVTDPKGEIYAQMSETLRRNGYDVQVFNLSEPSKSSRWNPFENSWHMYQRAYNLDNELVKRVNQNPADLGLRVISNDYQNEWYEFNKVAFPTYSMAELEKKTLKQRLISDCEADVKDICAMICPIENDKDPSWEQGARDLIQGTVLAMLEDSLNPALGMTKDKFNFYNVFKMLSLRDNDPNASFATIKNYFEGRDKLSPAAQMAQTVVSNAENTMKNFFGVATQKLSMFADKGVCYITSDTEIDFGNFIKQPTAFFLVIPDQIKIRHTLATLCVNQLYKKLVELANSLGGTLKWPTYFILDEFGNMPRLEDFATIITVARSRGVFFTLVLQDYKQLETTYKEAAVTIRNNCNTQIFIGVNDMDTRKMFSDLMGEMTVDSISTGTSKNTGKAAENDKDGGSTSRNINQVSRPLLPPNELLDLKPGLIYVYCFGFHPLKSKVTMFYQVVKSGAITLYPLPDTWCPSRYFDEENIFYDIRRRNEIVIKNARKADIFDW